ncbi:HesB/YadR/YfhF family protein [Effusibacillus pohliae]|uniref:HesB/YadR/YfhF family protein n=1 Tax=Effusibacillus pohliae TaxID=232270 RepID=UPI0003786564|nr:HesB/YadR/YfhF family protein [Effusibacillus pohliae]
MKITVTKTAVDWFKREMDAKPGEAIRFFARLGGCSTVQSGFSLGMAKESPRTAGISTTEDGITFFMEEEDVWYLNGGNLIVDYDQETDELKFVST